MINLGKPKNILIKTYTHESGLFYLAESLIRALEKEGHRIKLLPKAKFVKTGNGFKKTYLPNSETLVSVLPMTTEQPASQQILKHVQDNNIQVVISLETLMETANWIGALKRKTGVQIIDVPMLEWVNPQYLKNKAYNQFDQIWALTNSTERIFKEYNYPQVVRVNWDYVDRGVFYYDPNPFPGHSDFVFFHQASLNPDHSTKNTSQVIEAFASLNYNGVRDIRLILSGKLDLTTQQEIEKLKGEKIKITYFDRLLSRKEVANIYSVTGCVVAPSSKEGLGLSLYEAQACGCQLITTDTSPMNELDTKYLCQVSSFKQDKTLVPSAELTSDNIYQQMKRVYEDCYVR